VRHCRWLVDQDVGLAVFGTNSEANSLGVQEKRALLDALLQAGAAVTDEASAIEHLGHSPLLVRGSAHNLKVTYPEDFALAEALLQARGEQAGDAR